MFTFAKFAITWAVAMQVLSSMRLSVQSAVHRCFVTAASGEEMILSIAMCREERHQPSYRSGPFMFTSPDLVDDNSVGDTHPCQADSRCDGDSTAQGPRSHQPAVQDWVDPQMIEGACGAEALPQRWHGLSVR